MIITDNLTDKQREFSRLSRDNDEVLTGVYVIHTVKTKYKSIERLLDYLKLNKKQINRDRVREFDA